MNKNMLANRQHINPIAGHYMNHIRETLGMPNTQHKLLNGQSSRTISPLNVMEVSDFIKMPLPKRENILSPWLPVQGLTMIYAPRGIGKTHIALGIAYAVVSNTPFLGWQPSKPRGVLYLDGEMPASLMQERLLVLLNKKPVSLSAPFRLMTPDLQPHGMLDLATLRSQILLENRLNDIELIIVDNISTLCRNSKENEADSWLPVQEWALKMRASGRSVLFIHHAGKGGHQRGTSKREDILDTVIALKRPCDYKPKDGAIFEIHFEKARGFFGEAADPFEAQLIIHEDGVQEWIMRPVSSNDQILDMVKQGYKQNEIAEKVNLHKSNVSRHIKRAAQAGKIP